ncbi:uncharacterized protein LOC144902964 [Branchiostoma floridae x Branchiostoma belcheri]
MSNKARRMLVLLLIILKEAGPTAACSSRCSSDCGCSYRGLTSVPQDLPTRITILYMGGNNIKTLSQSDFSRYRSLIRLELQYNQISMIHNNTFRDLTSLTTLDLNYNHLTNLTAGIFVGLGNLQTLYLSSNKLTSLPAGIFLALGSLEDLWLHSNKLSSLPTDIFVGLGNLQTLYFSRNQLATLPADIFVGLGNLQNLSLSRNELSSLPAGIFEGLGNLQHLWLYSNQLTILPVDIFVGLGNLEELYLDSNHIHSIEADTFNDTTQLHILELQYNNISTITADTLGNLLQLQTLRLSNNNINTFPVEALSNSQVSALSELTLHNNQLETLPLMAYDILANISTVNISNNPWQCDCRMVHFKQRMSLSGSYRFEDQIRCARPANLTGQYLLYVNPEDLICEETTPVYSTSGTKHMVHSTDPPSAFWSKMISTESNTGTAHSGGGIFLSVPLLATLGVILGLLLIFTIAVGVWCVHKKRQGDPTPLQGFSNSNPTGTSSTSGLDQLRLQAFATNAEIKGQSETPHSDTEDSQHIYNLPTDEDPDTAEYDTIDEVNQSESKHGVVSPSQTSQPGSGQMKRLGSFNDGYEVPSPSLYPGQGPQSHKYVNSHMAAAAKDAAAGPQDVVHVNDEESVDNQSQTAAAPGADSPHHYEPLKNPSSQQHTYTSLKPPGTS